MDNLKKHVRETLKNQPSFKKVVVGLSGGMDSTVLTHILKSLGYEVIIAHLNHSLRGNQSDQDEQFVVELAKSWELPYLTKKVVLPETGNQEALGRQTRYSYFEEVRQAYQADFIAVGHHFDDQIETILMHEKRGAGLRGTRGMQVLSGKILRPLLNVSRKDIEMYAKKNLLDFVVDESNQDTSYARNHLRHKVIPKLKETPGFEEEIRKKSREAAQMLDSLKEETDVWIDNAIDHDNFLRKDFSVLSKELKTEIVIQLLGQRDLYSKSITRLVNFIESGKTGKELRIKDKTFIIEYDRIRIVDEHQKLLEEAWVEDEVIWGSYQIKVKDKLRLKVRTWKAGDRFKPRGMAGHKKLQNFFVDQKIPRHMRGKIPIVVDEKDAIICVGNMRFSDDHPHLKEHIEIKKIA